MAGWGIGGFGGAAGGGGEWEMRAPTRPGVEGPARPVVCEEEPMGRGEERGEGLGEA